MRDSCQSLQVEDGQMSPPRLYEFFLREIFYKAAHDLAGATPIVRNLRMREMDFQAASLFRLFEKKNLETSICGEK